MITAAYGPKLDGDRTKSGFATRKEALEYIRQFLCEGCKKEVQQGYHEIEFPSQNRTLRSTTEDELDTSCGAEWLLLPDEKWQEYLADDHKGFRFILAAAGYATVEKRLL